MRNGRKSARTSARVQTSPAGDVYRTHWHPHLNRSLLKTEAIAICRTAVRCGGALVGNHRCGLAAQNVPLDRSAEKHAT